MLVIWYNADLKEYRFGNTMDYALEAEASADPGSYSILMKLDGASKSLANKVIKQLNVTESKLAMYGI